MEYTLIGYPSCTTCKKAWKHLLEHTNNAKFRHIKDECPSEKELSDWSAISGIPINKFFNTSGLVYKELGLKDQMKQMNDHEKIALLANNGMLIKRPILLCGARVLVGYKQEEYTLFLTSEV